METTAIKRSKTYDMVYISVFTILIAICSWISIPTAVPFTMQTFAIFLTVGVLGGRRGTISIAIYILLGIIGIPVFVNFTSGLGVLLGNTGGYIVGFLGCSLLMWGMEKLLGRKTWVLAISMIIGMLLCYAVGTVWFMYFYARNAGAIGVGTVLAWCVVPFIIPDIIKIALALTLSKRLSKIMNTL